MFVREIAGKELELRAVNDAGEPLADGVCLYRVWVGIDAMRYPMEIQKSAIVR